MLVNMHYLAFGIPFLNAAKASFAIALFKSSSTQKRTIDPDEKKQWSYIL